MTDRKVTSIRLDSNLLEAAAAFGINVSKLCESTLKTEINLRLLNEGGVIPSEISGISENARVVMDNKKLKGIKKIKVGDRVVSYNLSTNRFEGANVIDVGPLTPEKAFATSITMEAGTGTILEVLADTKVYCSDSHVGSGRKWVLAKNVKRNYTIMSISSKSAGGSTWIKRVKKNVGVGLFYRLEVYPNNNFFANSNIRRPSHYLEDYMSSVWALPVKGYQGQIGSLLG